MVVRKAGLLDIRRKSHATGRHTPKHIEVMTQPVRHQSINVLFYVCSQPCDEKKEKKEKETRGICYANLLTGL